MALTVNATSTSSVQLPEQPSPGIVRLVVELRCERLLDSELRGQDCRGICDGMSGQSHTRSNRLTISDVGMAMKDGASWPCGFGARLGTLGDQRPLTLQQYPGIQPANRPRATKMRTRS